MKREAEPKREPWWAICLGIAMWGLFLLLFLSHTWDLYRVWHDHLEVEATVDRRQCGAQNTSFYTFQVEDVVYHGNTGSFKGDCAQAPAPGSKVSIYYAAEDPNRNMPLATGNPRSDFFMFLCFDLFCSAVFVLLLRKAWNRLRAA